MFLKKLPPIFIVGGYKYYTYCPVCGCVANYMIGYNKSFVFCSDKYRIYSFICLDCGAEHCFNEYGSVIKDCLGVRYY